MSFVNLVKKQLDETPFSEKSRRNILKVVLGEIQRKSVNKEVPDETCYKVVKGMIDANQEVISMLAEDDSRCEKYLAENDVLEDLVPVYWSELKIKEALSKIDLKSVENFGRAMGMAMKHLKSLDAFVEGNTVKSVVLQIMEK